MASLQRQRGGRIGRGLAGLVFAGLLALIGTAHAQEARGTITGTVLDSTGAAVPGATVTVTNMAMGTTTTVTTSEVGFFQAPYLIPGEYQVSAELSGFKRLVREGVQVRVADRVSLELVLETGDVAEAVTVTADAPLLNTTDASLGQVVDARRIAELPIAHGDPYKLIGLAAGTSFARSALLDRPFEPTHIVGYTMSGARANRSDITIDGVPATSTANAGEVIASYVPPQDLVQEFKVQTATFDASFGNTEGGVTNLVLKSGSNAFHGSAYFVKTPRDLFANDFFANRTGTPLPDFRYNRWGGTVGGPMIRNRTFFMYGYEGIHEARPRNNGTRTGPTDAMLNGDFSALLALGPEYQIYNPYTRRQLPDGRLEADPFPGNIIPQELISPQARGIADFMRGPRNAGNPDGTQNMLRPDLKEETEYATHTIRVDHVATDQRRLYGRFSWYDRNSNYNNFFESIATGQWFRFVSRSAAADYVNALNNTTVLNVRYGYDRFLRGTDGNPGAIGFDLASVGFPSYLNDFTPADMRRFPRVNFPGGTYQGTGVGGEDRPTETQSVLATLNKAMGAHSLKLGTEFRRYREQSTPFGNNMTAEFSFNSQWTRGPFNNSAPAPNELGQSFAAFMLGLPSSGQIVRSPGYDEHSTTWGFFAQDDWRIGSRLTLNLGLRYEFETPLSEAQNRTVRGFDLNAVQPISDAVQAAYAANPIPEVPPSAFALRGGLTFPGVGGQPEGLYETPKSNVMPRAGFAYQLNEATVLRGGYGLFYGFLGQRRGDVVQSGFSANTPMVVSLDNGLTFIETLSNPFQSGIVEPQGASQGIETFLGQSVSFFNEDPKTPRTQRWQIGIQREMAGWVAEASYVGAHGTNVETTRNLNAIPLQYLSGTGARNQANLEYLTQQVPNPFFGIMPATAGSALRGATIERWRLLRPFPHFDNVVTTTSEGKTWYNAVQLSLNRRFAAGYTLATAYTYSKFEESTQFLNCVSATSGINCADDPGPTRHISDMDVPHKLSVSGIWELPFGRGTSGTAAKLLDGWQLSGVYSYQTGFPIGNFPKVIFNGNFDNLALGNPTVEQWFNVDAGFNRVSAEQLTSFDTRAFPLRVTELRNDPMNNVDLSLLKRTDIFNGKALELRFEALNAFNSPQFASPPGGNLNPVSGSFAQVTSGVIYARRVQVHVRLIF